VLLVRARLYKKFARILAWKKWHLECNRGLSLYKRR